MRPDFGDALILAHQKSELLSDIRYFWVEMRNSMFQPDSQQLRGGRHPWVSGHNLKEVVLEEFVLCAEKSYVPEVVLVDQSVENKAVRIEIHPERDLLKDKTLLDPIELDLQIVLVEVLKVYIRMDQQKERLAKVQL